MRRADRGGRRSGRWPAHRPAAQSDIDDQFGGPSPEWQITSGALTFTEGVGGTDSPVFRMNSVDRSFDNVIVTATLAVDELHGGPDWSGVHIWVRYQSEYELYAVSVDREDGTMIIKKKCAGGDSNGGTYYDLTDYQGGAAVPFGEWQNVSGERYGPAGRLGVDHRQPRQPLDVGDRSRCRLCAASRRWCRSAWRQCRDPAGSDRGAA